MGRHSRPSEHRADAGAAVQGRHAVRDRGGADLGHRHLLGAAASYVREGYSNIRVGMFLEAATTAGALAGAFVAGLIPTSALTVVFGLFLLYSAAVTLRARHETAEPVSADPTATRPNMRPINLTPVSHRL